MFVVSARVKADTATAHLNALERKQLPFAYSLAVNRTAKLVKQAEIDKMRAVFDRPTPYTLNSLYVKPGTKANPSAYVWLKYDTFKGTPAEKYLLPQIDGGSRSHKRFERALQGVGAMPTGYYCIPGKFAQMDNYGNWSRGQIIKILSYFRAFPERGYRANMTDAALWHGAQKRNAAIPSWLSVSTKAAAAPASTKSWQTANTGGPLLCLFGGLDTVSASLTSRQRNIRLIVSSLSRCARPSMLP